MKHKPSMPLYKKDIEYLKQRFSSNAPILKILGNEYKKDFTFIKTYKKISKLLKPSISNETIQLFYSEPKNFFENHIKLLNNTSYFDELGNSILVHYFNILYNIFIQKNNLNDKNNEIYLSNFLSFFKAHEKNIAILDLSLDTPLHKIARRNVIFIMTYYNLLKDINVVNEKILSIKNSNEESCFDYIINEIEVKYSNKVTKNDFELYKNFLNTNKTYIKLITFKKQLDLKLFSLSINFHLKSYKDITFKEIYSSLNLLLKNEKGKIINYSYFFNEDINILNNLYHYSKNEEKNLDNLFKLIKELLNPNLQKLNKLKEIIKNEKNKNEISLQHYIYNHIGYVLRKMEKNNNNEIYGVKLIKEILPLLLNYYSFDEFKDKEKVIKLKKIKFNNNSIMINLAKNPNINFEKKYEILNILEYLLKDHFDQDTDEDVIFLYKLFKLYNKEVNNKKILNESTITSYFKKYEFIRKIFIDFFFLGKLYRSIYSLCKEYDNINLEKYIKELSNFILTKKDIFETYKISYLMNDNNISIIIKIIILFEKQNYFNEIEEEYLSRKIIKLNNKNKTIYEKLFKEFILSNSKLTFYYIKNIISNSQINNKNLKKKLYIDFLDIFFSFKFDFEKFALNKNIIYFFSNKSKEEFKIYEKKLKNNLNAIKNNKNIISIYKFILKYSPKLNNLYIFNYTVSIFSILIKKYLYQLLFKWNEDCDFKDLSNLIKENIVPFCKLFLDLKDTLNDRKNKINFFFDEFINILDPAFKSVNFQKYKQLALNYMDLNQDSEDNFFYQLDYKIYFTMMLIFIRLKFGKYNPSILYLYIIKNKSNNNFFLLFLKSYFNDIYKNNIPYHFLLLESNISSTYPDKYNIQYNKFKNIFYFPNISYEHYQEIILFYIAYFQN